MPDRYSCLWQKWPYFRLALTAFGAFALSPRDLLRAAVAGNVSAPMELLAKLAQDDNPTVRRAVAGNVSAPACLLANVARIHNQEALQKRFTESTTSWGSAYKLGDPAPYDIVEAVSSNTSAAPDTLAILPVEYGQYTSIRFTETVALEGLVARSDLSATPTTTPLRKR